MLKYRSLTVRKQKWNPAGSRFTPLCCILRDRRATLWGAFHPAIKWLPALQETQHVLWFLGSAFPVSLQLVLLSYQNSVALQVSSSPPFSSPAISCSGSLLPPGLSCFQGRNNISLAVQQLRFQRPVAHRRQTELCKSLSDIKNKTKKNHTHKKTPKPQTKEIIH